jgi:hypothetical protein
MAHSVTSNQAACWALKDSVVESVGIFLHGESTPCKFKPDALNLEKGLIVDIKTTRDASLSGFNYQARSLKYNIQAAFYIMGVEALYGRSFDFLFVAVESAPPFGVGVYSINSDVLLKSRDLIEKTIPEITKAIELNEFNDYNNNDIMELQF